MGQIKIYGLREELNPIKAQLSDAIHAAVVEALSFPQDKRAHRFFPLAAEDFYYPAGRSTRYTIIEISMFEGRLLETKKRLIRLLYERIVPLGIAASDLEITIFETPRSSWGLRGQPADEMEFNYRVEV